MNRNFAKQIFTVFICLLLAQFAVQAQSNGGPNDQQSTPSTAQFSPEELQQLVAPIALYPDALVAQILAASTYPTQIVEADRWMQDHSGLHGDKLAKEVNEQSWDPNKTLRSGGGDRRPDLRDGLDSSFCAYFLQRHAGFAPKYGRDGNGKVSVESWSLYANSN